MLAEFGAQRPLNQGLLQLQFSGVLIGGDIGLETEFRKKILDLMGIAYRIGQGSERLIGQLPITSATPFNVSVADAVTGNSQQKISRSAM